MLTVLLFLQMDETGRMPMNMYTYGAIAQTNEMREQSFEDAMGIISNGIGQSKNYERVTPDTQAKESTLLTPYTQQDNTHIHFMNTTIGAIRELEKLQAKNEWALHSYRCYCCYSFFLIDYASAPTQVINTFFKEIDTRQKQLNTHIRCSCCWLKNKCNI